MLDALDFSLVEACQVVLSGAVVEGDFFGGNDGDFFPLGGSGCKATAFSFPEHGAFFPCCGVCDMGWAGDECDLLFGGD